MESSLFCFNGSATTPAKRSVPLRTRLSVACVDSRMYAVSWACPSLMSWRNRSSWSAIPSTVQFELPSSPLFGVRMLDER